MVNSGMDLGLRDQSIEHEDFGYTFSLLTTGGYEISIEADFTLAMTHQSLRFSPEPSNTDSEELAALVGQSIVSATAENSGRLAVEFANGDRLIVEPDPAYEAWTVAGPGGVEAVCMPGGELATWETDNT